MLPYDDSNPRDIERYAKGLIGKTFQDVLYDSRFLDDAIIDSKIDYSNPNQKGKLGNLLEEKYFCYKANSDQEPDFPKCGVELKATCFDVLKNGNLSAGERLVLTMISYDEPIEPDFFKSHVWEKCRLILLVYYERNKALRYNTLYRIGFVSLFKPFEEDMPIIINDYKKIIAKIESGLAHELSEGDTMYLGACTKGISSEGSLVKQFYNPVTYAKKRAFCFKRKYMDYILHTYVIPQHSKEQELEPIVQDFHELITNSFEQIVTDKLSRYMRASDKSLCKYFEMKYDKHNKLQWVNLTYKMLGIKGNKAEEFVKANVVVKVVRLENDFTLKQSVSLPTFKFLDLANEEKWEDSKLYNYLSETKFFFVVFKRDGKVYRLDGCKFWNMSMYDLNKYVKRDWELFRCHIRNGVRFHIAQNGRVENSLPKIDETNIVHVRPHTKQAAYYIKIPNGRVVCYGDIEKYANMLPQGDWMTTQSFWLNNDYVLHQILN